MVYEEQIKQKLQIEGRWKNGSSRCGSYFLLNELFCGWFAIGAGVCMI